MSGKYALIIGNTEYTDPGLAQLTAPGKDVEDFARVLKDHDICAFDDVKILLNEPEYTVRGGIEELFDQKKPDDLLVLYFSGHGVRNELGELYLAVMNTKRFRLRSTAVKSDFIREAMDQSRSKRQVLILDCCNSGAFAQGTKAAAGMSIGTATAFQSGYGRIILTASDSTQFAWEGDKVIGETDNSLFTHFLVEGLGGEADLDGDGCITVDELFDYTYDKVKLSTPKQTPSKFSSKQQGEIILRQNMRIEDIKPVALPDDLISEMEDLRPYVREAAVHKLEKIIRGKNFGMARSAIDALEKIAVDDNTTRRVAHIANEVLDSLRQAKQMAEEELRAGKEEERLVIQPAKDDRLVHQRIESEQKAKEEAERSAHAQFELEIAKQETARLRAERKAMEKAAREATVIAIREKAARSFAWIVDGFNQMSVYGKTKWDTLANYVQSVPRNRFQIYIPVSLAIPFIAITSFLLYQQFDDPVLFFSRNVGGAINVYSYNDNTISRITSSGEGVGNWSPAISAFGEMYFISNRTGKAEIYHFNKDGKVQQVTNTPGTAVSWSPAVSAFGELYFISDRTGKAEIYHFNKDSKVQQVTNTPGTAASWSPAVSAFGEMYFTSNRTGKAEIYHFNKDGKVQQVTDTPGTAASWSPAVSAFGELYFTSNRTGKAEIYHFNKDGKVQQVTNTPGTAASWSPAIRGNNLYFTSNRDGRYHVYLLQGTQAVKISLSESWTTTLSARYPSSSP